MAYAKPLMSAYKGILWTITYLEAGHTINEYPYLRSTCVPIAGVHTDLDIKSINGIEYTLW